MHLNIAETVQTSKESVLEYRDQKAVLIYG